MKNFSKETYGDAIAEIYDELYSACDPAMVATLFELSAGGPALELGIGTGRVALPLQEKGIEVYGIDASEAMVSRLRQKTGGTQIPLAIGDFASVPVEGKFALVYVVFNTFFALLTQEDQLRCFQNVAKHLEQNGCFVIEAFVPDQARFVSGQAFRVSYLLEDQVWLDASQHDPLEQLVTTQHIHLTDQGIRLYPVRLRYAWPSELDLMAKIAGLRLQYRWGDWQRGPFTAKSGRHVSVYCLSG